MSDSDIKVLQNEINHIKEQLDTLKCDIKCLTKAIQNRLPLWATTLIAFLTAAIAWFAKG